MRTASELCRVSSFRSTERIGGRSGQERMLGATGMWGSW